MINRFMIFLLLVTLVLPNVLIGCSDNKTTGQERNMDIKRVIPPIDTSAVTKTETATFALG